MMIDIRKILMVLLMFAPIPSVADIRKTQTYLSDLGYNAGPIDGLWGKKTEQALVRFLSDKSQVWDGKFDEEEFKFLEKVWVSENSNSLISINKTTSRYLRARNNCDVAKSIDEVYKQAFDHELSDHLFAFADLNQDNKLDLIQGFEEEPYNTTNIRQPVDYRVFMSDGSSFPEKLPNLIARKILVQDFNDDGRHDVVFLNTGPHKPPRPGLTNRILLSEPNGYLFRELPGGSRISHGGAAGDLDRDGDVDIIVANGQQENVQMLINLGNGKFKSKTLYSKFAAHPYTAEVWDVDQDGLLDIIFGVPAKGFYVSYGKPSKPDNPKFERPMNYAFEVLNDRLPLDFAFEKQNQKNGLDIYILDSRLGPNSYRGWGINSVKINSRRQANLVNVFDFDPGDNYHWNPWIDVCDLDGDGSTELVSNKIGRDNMWALKQPKQIVWNFDGNWSQIVYPRGLPVDHSKLGKVEQPSQKSDYFSALSNEELCSNALIGVEWNRATGHFKEAKRRGLNINQCQFYKDRLLPRKPDGTIKTKEVCENAVQGNDWNGAKPLWVSEAKSRNLTIDLCEFFTSN